MGRVRLALVLLRWLAVLAPGYIHPDEFFQGPEPMSHDILQLQATIPWEFAEKPPCRSVISAALTSGIPLLVVKLFGPGQRSRWVNVAVLLAPRLWMVALSFTLDSAIVHLCEAFGLRSHVQSALLVFGSAWPGLFMLSRPFSNSLEAVLLGAALIVSVRSCDRAGAAWRWRWFGLISAVGVFTRFTFVVFGAVISTWMVVDALGLPVLRRTFGRTTSTQDWQMWRTLLLDVCGGAAVFLAASATIVVADSLYFGTMSLTYSYPHPAKIEHHNQLVVAGGTVGVVSPAVLLWRVLLGDADEYNDMKAVASSVGLLSRINRVGYTGHLTFTPLNSYRYNANPVNLAKHGLHPRWTHVVVNMPMMFGPLVVLGLLELRSWLVCRATSNAKRAMAGETYDSCENVHTASMHSPVSGRNLHVLSASIVMLYLGVLSTAPHQEARFLLPLLLPMSILFGARLVHGKCVDTYLGTGGRCGSATPPNHSSEVHQHQPTSSSLLMAIWIAFNLSVSIFFGGLHQAGVTQALLQMGTGSGLDILGDDGETTAGTAGSIHPDAGRPGPQLEPQAMPITTVFFHTYMPPVALIGQNALGPEVQPHEGDVTGGIDERSVSRDPIGIEILDLTSNSSIVALENALSNLLKRGNSGFINGERDGSVDEIVRHVFVISPGSIDLGSALHDFYEDTSGRTKTTGSRIQLVLEPKVQWWPHLSMEDPPWEATSWENGHLIDHLLRWSHHKSGSGGGLLTLVLWRARTAE